MSKTHLPKHIEPIKLADRRTHLEGTLALVDMLRLQGLLYKSEGDIAVSLDFGVDVNGLRYIKGSAKTDVSLVCQRCMQPFNYVLKSKIQLSPVDSDKAATELSPDYEPLLIAGDGLVALNDLVEDELILGLPLVTAHEPSACPVQMISTKPAVTKSSAFEVLKSLKKD